MTNPEPTDILATLLSRAEDNDHVARNVLLNELYPRLRAIAGSMLQKERPDHTLQPTALVNEAWIRLAASDNLDRTSKTKFLAAAAQTIRRVLIDHARVHDAQKRGGGEAKLELTDVEAPSEPSTVTSIGELDSALQAMQAEYPRQHQVVELKYFAGLTVKQIAEVLGLAERTVANDWVFASAWLRSRLEKAR